MTEKASLSPLKRWKKGFERMRVVRGGACFDWVGELYTFIDAQEI